MKPFLLIPLLASCALTARAAYQDVVLADQPVGYWRLGEAAGSTLAVNAGSLGAVADGTTINNVTFGLPGALQGNPDTAANLDGAQAKIEVPFQAGLNTATFTIEVWARVASGSSNHRSPLASRDDGPQKGFIFYADPADNWQFWTGTGQQVGWDVVGGALVEYDAWAHLVGVYDGANKLFYVNGVLVGGDRSLFTPNGARVLRIGGSANESPVGDFFFMGDVDEVAVYDKALGADAVVAHYTAGSGAPPDAGITPGIALQPAPADRFKGETVTFNVLATGSLPLSYQWQKNGTDISGATGTSLTLANLQPEDSADYSVVVSNGAGSLPSDPAALTVADVTKPIIERQPRSRTLLPGTTAQFSVVASGSTVFEYQWQFDGQNLANATNATLTISNVQTAQLGTYRVTVKNAAGTTDSDPATLQFPAPATKSYVETVKQDSPVGYWRLGEATGEFATDAMGANDGFYLNGVTLGRPGAPVGDVDTAAGFQMAAQTKMDVSWSEALNAPAFTVECWARVTGGTGSHRSPVTSRAGTPERGYIFYAEPGDTWQFWTGPGTAGWTILPGPAVQMNAYAHLVGLYDGTTMSFYVNGVLVSQLNAAFGPNDANPLRIGGGATEGDGNYFFEGDVDEVAVYDQALSEERILAHFVAGFPLTTPPTVTGQPKSKWAPPGATVTFTVSATGGLPLGYQWHFNGQPLADATASALTITSVSAANAGDYHVIVSNAGGTATSSTATLTIPTPPTKTYVELVKADGPVAYWRLGEAQGEVADDEIGANDGTYLNGVVLGVPGALPTDANTAARFSAASLHKLDVPWSDLLNPPQFTVEVWARLTGGSSYRSPLTSRADQPQRGYIFYAEPDSTWHFWSGKGDQSGWDNLTGPAVNLNQWEYLAATYDGTIKRFFVNGVEVGSSTAAFGPNDQSPLRLGGGASEGDGSFFFEGDIDEPAVYAKALTEEQIILHYMAGIAGGAPPSIRIAQDDGRIVVTWDAGTLETATDVSGPWAPAGGATSPYTVPAGGPSTSFYRARK